MSTQEQPPRSARYMTFRELLDNKHESSPATCRFCKGWTKRGRYYGVRHFVCVDCCEKRGDEKLPSVVKREKACSAFANRIGGAPEAKFIATVSGVTIEYAQWVIDQGRAEREARDNATTAPDGLRL